MNKIVRIGFGPRGNVYCRIQIEDGKLSITGVEGPKANGDAFGGCGQIEMHEWEIKEYAPGWSPELEQHFREVWRRWHLNDMTPNCEHQVGPEWTPKDVTIYHWMLTTETYKAREAAEQAALGALKRGEVFTPTPEQTLLANLPYSKTTLTPDTPDGYKLDKTETKRTSWLRQEQHPEGYLGKPCPVCGYKYGSKWLKEELPADVVAFLEWLPDADQKPAWV